MSERMLRYLQVQVTLEQAKESPGKILTEYFSKVELISQVSWKGDTPQYLLNLEYEKETELENLSIEGIYEIIEVISRREKSALVIARFHGPILLLVHQINECWLQTPSVLSSTTGLLLTVHGTTNGLKRFRDGLKGLLPDSIKLRITKNLKADWIAAPKLPQRRKEVMNLAVKRGYYKTPRKCTQRDLADELGVRQGTIAEHLQSAEGLIIESWSEQAD